MSEVSQNKIYILGAGSSISHSKKIFPNINTIFQKAYELHVTVDESNTLNSAFQPLETYLRDYYNYSLLEYDKQIDFEKIFTLVDIEMYKNHLSFEPIRFQLVDLLQNVFIKLKDKLNDEIHREYIELTKMVKYPDTVISFNWDVLLDDNLGRIEWLKTYSNEEQICERGGRENTYSMHYERFIKTQVFETPYFQGADFGFRDAGFYLKLHGSMDWHICKNSLCRYYNLPIPKLYPLKNTTCNYCFEKVETLIVPPTLNKSINSIPFIAVQWKIASLEILKASSIIIWGYSLPSTDFYSEWLLRQARKSNCLNEVVLINPCKEHRKKIIGLFIGMDIETSEYNCFEDYVNGISDRGK